MPPRVTVIALAGLLTASPAGEPQASAVLPSQQTPPPPVMPSVQLAAKSVALDPLLAGDVWDWSVERFTESFPADSFSWATEKRDRAVFFRVPKKGRKVDLRLGGGLKPVQATVDFAEGKPSRIVVFIYTRGDASSLTREQYETLLRQTEAALEKRFGSPAADPPPVAEKKAVRVESVRWHTGGGTVAMEASAGKGGDFRAEFVRVSFTPPGSGGAGKPAVRADLVQKVRRDAASGDVWIDAVPMVDQGVKGYCVLASCQRLFEYFGIAVDQHELAQLTGASSGGTNLLTMQEALQRIDGRMKVRVRILIAPMTEQDEYFRLMQSYNQAAKKAGKPELDYRRITYDIATLDPAAVREAKLKGGGFDRFVRAVRESTDRGVPLLWALELGMYPEIGTEPKVKSASHMRLIIGYNARSREILFTDTWGKGHELKRMAAADAFAATMGLYLMEPVRR